MKQGPITAVIVGAGHRALTYASYARRRPDQLKIVGVAEPDAHRRLCTAQLYDIPPERCFVSAEELAAHAPIADAVINGTMDLHHVPTSLPLLVAGYHLLLEKPFAVSEAEMWQLAQAAQEHERTVMICHVLRYAPFYAMIRERVAAGEIGEILSLDTTEHVSYHHMAVAFIRGKWSNEQACGSSMLMSKCCHDLDLIAWMKSGVAPLRVSSFGGLSYFTSARAPKGAGTRCIVDCPIEDQCLYSARKHYLDHPQRWSAYVWNELQEIENPTIEQKTELLKTSVYGRCVWRSDNNVIDHQSVLVEFADGCSATHNLVGGTARPARTIHLLGTHGEISGCLEDNRFVIRHIDPRPGHEYAEHEVDVRAHGSTDGHGGGDLRLVADFCRVLQGEAPSLSYTGLEDSIAGHLIGFRADVAMREHRVEELCMN
jgi:predicted dehydrogenase